MSGSAGGSVSVSKSKSRSQSGTYFPSMFLNAFENRYGRGVSTDELMGMLPQTQSIFGGGPVGYGYTGGQTGQAGAPSGQAPGGTPQTPTGTYTLDNLTALANQYYNGHPNMGADVTKRILAGARQAGLDPSKGFTADQLRAMPGVGDFVHQTLPALAGAGSQQNGPRYAPLSGGPDLSALQIPQTIQRLFGAGTDTPYSPYQFRDVPTINTPNAAAEQANIAPGGYDAYQQALYRSMVNPMQRTLTQQGAEDDRALQAELAQSGLASSGAGLGQISEQRRQRSEQLRSASLEAADRATQQRFGAEFAQEQFNARQRQEANLANAGFSLDAQKANAANILNGDIARSDSYLKTLGLNADKAHAMRQDFLGLLGITQEEMKRLDQSQVEKLGLFLNNWLQQGALLGNLGQASKSGSSSSGVGVSGYAGGGAGGS